MEIAGIEKKGLNPKNVKNNTDKNNANGKQPTVIENYMGNHNSELTVVTPLISDHVVFGIKGSMK